MGLTALLLIATLEAQAPSRAAVDAFERAAAVAERYVDVDCALYDRSEGYWCVEQAGASLNAAGFTVAELESLTRHANPRVRTLALLKIAQRADPQLLPIVFALVPDTADTYPAHTPVAMVMRTDYTNVPKTRQSVGEIAEQILKFYLEPAGYSYSSLSTSRCPAFQHYWERRKHRTVLASWLTVELYRATQRTPPIPPDREAWFAALRRKIEQLSGDDRLWYSLHIGASEGGHRVFSETETLAAAKTIGPERLMAMIRGTEPAFDPDLVMVGRPESCGGLDASSDMRRFVLEHSSQLLRATDADALQQAPDEKYSLWSTAAAALRPVRAATILKPRIEAIDRNVFGWDQARMAAALLRYGGTAHIPYALDWFYGRSPDETMTNAQEIFMREFTDKWTDLRVEVLTRLVRDRRFDRISTPALRFLILRINAVLEKPLVDDPYGYLGEGAQEARTLAEWRRLVRDSIPRWK